MTLNKLLTTLLILLFPVIIFSQSSGIKGNIIDGSNKEPLIGVTIVVEGTQTGNITDYDGNFFLELLPGVYNIKILYLSYKDVILSDVIVNQDEIVNVGTISMIESSEVLEEVVVTADVNRSSDANIFLLKRKSAGLLDGISSSLFSKIGDSNVSSAVKRVSGVSVEGGKYVYVRGIGDRYTSVTLNGIEIPALDPDLNSIQIDIFPTNIVDNITISKTGLSENKAEFGGGLVNIETKDFPNKNDFSISVGGSYNPLMSMNKNFLTYNGGSLDWLGMDDGTRSLPSGYDKKIIPSPISGHSKKEIKEYITQFSPTLGVDRRMSNPNYNFGLSNGNSFNIGRSKLGYILSLSYNREYRYYGGVEYGEYLNSIDPDNFDLIYATRYKGDLGEDHVLLNGLLGVSYGNDKHKIRLVLNHIQNGISRAGKFEIDNNGEAVGQSGYYAISDNLEYTERRLSNLLINGVHNIGRGFKIDWRISPTISSVSDPDIRKTAFTITEVDTSFIAGAGGNPSRIWRDLSELNLNYKIDVNKEYRLFNNESILKFGGYQVNKNRDYEILSYDIQFFGAQPDFNGEPNNVLREENIYPNGKLYYSSGNNDPNPNQYNSKISLSSFYISNEFKFFNKLRLSAGVRGEYFKQWHTGRDVEYSNFGVGNNLDDELVLNSFDIFPSVNFVYSLNNNNFRLSYYNTISRPTFKELSFAQIIDPMTNRIYNGGLYRYSDWDGNLSETRLNNVDVRWELFMDKTQLISITGFYKRFNDAIELVRIPEQQTNIEYQPRNVGDGNLIGIELEIVKSLDIIHNKLSNYKVIGNLTLIESSIRMSETEIRTRNNFIKTGQKIGEYREMAGQAPYIVNLGLLYNNETTSTSLGVFYNVKGESLQIVGGGIFPDVYTKPFHSLNLNLSQSFLNKKLSISFGVNNILNQTNLEVYRGYKTNEGIFTKRVPGVEYGIGVRYSM